MISSTDKDLLTVRLAKENFNIFISGGEYVQNFSHSNLVLYFQIVHNFFHGITYCMLCIFTCSLRSCHTSEAFYS